MLGSLYLIHTYVVVANMLNELGGIGRGSFCKVGELTTDTSATQACLANVTVATHYE